MANKLTDLYGDLKSTIVGTKTQKIDIALDKAVKDIIQYKSNSGRNGYIDLVKTVIAKSSTVTCPANVAPFARITLFPTSTSWATWT